MIARLKIALLLTASCLHADPRALALGSSDDTCSTATVVTPGTYISLQTSGSWTFPNNITFDSDWFRFTAWPGQTVDVNAAITGVSGNHSSGYYTFMAAYEYSSMTCNGTQIATSFANHVQLSNSTSVPKDYVVRYYAGVNNSGQNVAVTYDLTLDGHEVGQSFCFGDGTGTACPCANAGSSGRGCASSSFNSGARLSAAGNAGASVGTDTLTLAATEITGPGLFFQGDATIAGGSGAVFGDGLLCAGGSIVRLGVVFPSSGIAAYPGGLTPSPVHIAGGTSSGDVRHYQCWYRDSAVFCIAETNNLTQVLTLTWGP